MDMSALADVLESIMNSPDSVGTTPEVLMSNITKSLTTIADILQNPSKYPDVEKNEIMSGLHNVSTVLLSLSDAVPVEESLGTEGMEPKLDSRGFPDYSNPNGSSYAEKNGFLG